MIIFIIHSVFVLYFLVEIAVVKLTILHPAFKLFFSGGFQYLSQRISKINNPKNCELWRSEWAKMCNRYLSIDNQIDHRSYERQGKLKVPTIHEGADARKIEEKYLTGQIRKGSWKVAENQMIKKQNALLQKVITTFGKVSGALSMWREWLNDIRIKQRSNSHDGSNDYTDRGTAEYHGRDASGDTGKEREADVLSDAGRTRSERPDYRG